VLRGVIPATGPGTIAGVIIVALGVFVVSGLALWAARRKPEQV
jgi:hypothetical protein